MLVLIPWWGMLCSDYYLAADGVCFFSLDTHNIDCVVLEVVAMVVFSGLPVEQWRRQKF